MKLYGTFEEAEKDALEATQKAIDYTDFKPWNPVVQRMLTIDCLAKVTIFETALIIEKAAMTICEENDPSNGFDI